MESCSQVCESKYFVLPELLNTLSVFVFFVFSNNHLYLEKVLAYKTLSFLGDDYFEMVVKKDEEQNAKKRGGKKSTTAQGW